MGKKDSSKTRVAPVFDKLQARDAEGSFWIGRLLSTPTRLGAETSGLTVAGFLEVAQWGDDEQALAPPATLLRWLVRNPSSLAPPRVLVPNLRALAPNDRRCWTAISGS